MHSALIIPPGTYDPETLFLPGIYSPDPHAFFVSVDVKGL